MKLNACPADLTGEAEDYRLPPSNGCTAHDWRATFGLRWLFANVVPPRQCKRCDRSFEARTNGYDSIHGIEDFQPPCSTIWCIEW